MTLSKEEFAAKHAQSKVTTDQLDEMFDFVMGKGSKVFWLISVIKLVAVVAYLWARQKCIDDSWLATLQKYEQEQKQKNRSEVDDDLA